MSRRFLIVARLLRSSDTLLPAVRRKMRETLIGAFQQLCNDGDRKSTRLNSSHSQISYAVFCLKKKKTIYRTKRRCIPCVCKLIAVHYATRLSEHHWHFLWQPYNLAPLSLRYVLALRRHYHRQ